jgi:RNA polymerase sigma-70 factor (ECF subfamily)
VSGIDTATEDRTLVERLTRGDAEAVELLMARFSDRVYRVAYGITRNSADAEETVQDVFLTVLRQIGRFEGRSALGTWIYRIAANTALNKRRGKRREVEVSLDELLPAFLPDGHRAGERAWVLADWSPRPDEELLGSEGRAALGRALEALPEHYRAVIVLHDVEELPNETVASMLGESLAAVKSRLHRARMVLREELTRAFHDL